MIDKLSNYFLDNVLYKNEKIEGDQREIMLFGITRIIEDIPKYTLILMISIIFNILSQVAIVLLITLSYKTFVGGVHARTNITCSIFSLLYFLFPVLVANSFVISKTIINILYIVNLLISLFVIYKIAPADTEEIPILNKKRRLTLKILAFISLISIYIVSLLILNNINVESIIVITLLIINICTTKPIYKFFKCKYSYESEEFKEFFNV